MEKTSFYPLSTYDYDSANLLIPENYGGVSEEDVKSAAQEAASQAVAKVVADAPEAYDTLKEVADWIASDDTKSAELTTKVSQNSENIQNVATNVTEAIGNLSTNLTNVANNLTTNITSVQNSLDAKIEAVRKTADSAKQISDTAYQNDKYTRELVDGLTENKQDKGDYALNGVSYTKEESDEKYLTEHQDVSSLATKDEVSAKANASDVYSKEEAEATFATQTVVNEEIAARISDKSAFESELATKADKSDTYSKDEIDNKGFLTEHQDISMLATKREVQDAADAAVAKVVDGANDSFDTLKEIADWIATDQTNSADLLTQINTNKSDISSLKTDKADTTSVYTKEEIEAKGYLTEHQDLTELKETIAAKADKESYTPKENEIYHFTNEWGSGSVKVTEIGSDYTLVTIVENDGSTNADFAIGTEYRVPVTSLKQDDELQLYKKDGDNWVEFTDVKVKITGKTDALNVYTKDEIDAKSETTDSRITELEEKVSSLTNAVAALTSTSTSEDALGSVLGADATVTLPENKYTAETPLNITKSINVE